MAVFFCSISMLDFTASNLLDWDVSIVLIAISSRNSAADLVTNLNSTPKLQPKVYSHLYISIYDLKCQSHFTWRNWSVTVPTEGFHSLPSSWIIVVASTLKTMHLKHALIISNALAAWAYCETRNGDILLVHNANWIKHHHLLYCLFQGWKIAHTYLLWM